METTLKTSVRRLISTERESMDKLNSLILKTAKLQEKYDELSSDRQESHMRLEGEESLFEDE